MSNKGIFDRIDWSMSGAEIEEESFRRIDAEARDEKKRYSAVEWMIVRRILHASADMSLLENFVFLDDPVKNGLVALAKGADIFCDSNMIRSGVSVERLKRINPLYTRDSVRCMVADEDVVKEASRRAITRSLAAVEKAGESLRGSIILIGNAPLALAGVMRLYLEGGIKPALVIGMPVGFVHVVESKDILMSSDIPQIVLRGRRGGSPMAVAALHGIIDAAS